MKRMVVILVLLLVFDADAQYRQFPATLVRMRDADTYEVKINLGWRVMLEREPVRLDNVSCAEKNTPDGQKAIAYAATLVAPGQTVTVSSARFDIEKYGRTLGRIALPDGRDLGTLLMEAGVCRAGDGKKG